MDINSTNKTALAASISIALAKARIALEKAVRRWPAGSANGLGGQFMPSNAAPGAGMLRGPRAKPRGGRQEVSANEPPPSPPVRLRGFSEAAGLPSRPDVSRWSPTHSTARSVINRINLLERYALDGDVASIQGMSTTRTNNYYRQLDNYRTSLLQHFEPAARIARMRGTMPEPVVLTGTNMANTALTSAQRHINRLTSIARESANPLEDLRNYTLGGGGPRTNTYLRRAQGYHAALVAHFSQGEAAASAPLGQRTQTSSSTTGQAQGTRRTQASSQSRENDALVSNIFSSVFRYADDINGLKMNLRELSLPERLSKYSQSFQERIAAGGYLSDLIGKNRYDNDFALLAKNLTASNTTFLEETAGAKILIALSAKAAISELYRAAQVGSINYLAQKEKTINAFDAYGETAASRLLASMNHEEFMRVMSANSLNKNVAKSTNPELLGLRRDMLVAESTSGESLKAPIYFPVESSGAMYAETVVRNTLNGGNYTFSLASSSIHSLNATVFGEIRSATYHSSGFERSYPSGRGVLPADVGQISSAGRAMHRILNALREDVSESLRANELADSLRARAKADPSWARSSRIEHLRRALESRSLNYEDLSRYNAILSNHALYLSGHNQSVLAHEIQYALTANMQMAQLGNTAKNFALQLRRASSTEAKQQIYKNWELARNGAAQNMRRIAAVNLADYIESSSMMDLAILSVKGSHYGASAMNGLPHPTAVEQGLLVQANRIADGFSAHYPMQIVTAFPNEMSIHTARNLVGGAEGAARQIGMWSVILRVPAAQKAELKRFSGGEVVDTSRPRPATTTATTTATSQQSATQSSGNTTGHRDFSGNTYRTLGNAAPFVVSSGPLPVASQNRIVHGISIEGTSPGDNTVSVTLGDIAMSSAAANPQGLSVNDLGFIPRPNLPLTERIRVDSGIAYHGSNRINDPAVAALAAAYMGQASSLQSRAREYQNGTWVPDTPEARARRKQQLAEQAARQAAEAERQRIEREQQEAQLRERLRDSITHEANIRSSLPEHWKPQSTIGANVTSFDDTTRNLSSSFASATMLTAEGREKFAKSLIADFGNNERFTVSVSGRDTSVNFSFTGNKGTSMSRTVSVDANGKVGVYHGYFRAGQRGAGAGKRFFRVAMGEYKAIGVSTVKVGANLDVGGYAWARFGYLPTDWRGIAGTIASKATSLFRQRSITAEVHSQISSICQDSDPKGLWKIADMDIGGRKIGKELLLGTSWGGVINLNNREQIERFSAYTAHG